MDNFSLPTLLASAGISAVISAVVALLASSSTKVRQMRAERAELARLRVYEVTKRMRRELRLYSDGMSHSSAREAKDGYHAADHKVCSEILAAAEGLGVLRRLLVEWRCRRIFGHFTYELSQDAPYNGSSPGHVIAPILVRQFNATKDLDVTGYLLSRAYCTPPGHASQGRARRQLVLLGRCF